LKDRFSRLFELSKNKMTIVTEMIHLGWGENDETWNWCRRLWAWEEDQPREWSLNSIVLQDDVNDMWLWIFHASKYFTVSSAYNFLLSSNQQNIADDNHVI
jgi:hypothetical protein